MSIWETKTKDSRVCRLYQNADFRKAWGLGVYRITDVIDPHTRLLTVKLYPLQAPMDKQKANNEMLNLRLLHRSQGETLFYDDFSFQDLARYLTNCMGIKPYETQEGTAKEWEDYVQSRSKRKVDTLTEIEIDRLLEELAMEETST